MKIGSRLEAIGNLVPQQPDLILADIGTDHAYLPVWLLERGRIKRALACDIAAGPCAAARATLALHNVADRVEVRQGSGLSVLRPGEADVISIAGMGGSLIAEILAADIAVAQQAQLLLLQPMAGAAGLRRWLVEHGWELVREEFVDDAPHFYEIMAARWTGANTATSNYSEAEYQVGPVLLARGHALLGKHFARLLGQYRALLRNMEKSERAKASAKYQEIAHLVAEVEELAHEHGITC